ncbi:MinD-like ATPase involved in chromosome partitioning or flagellar assembly [Fulvimarina manganoxydans]|uniref:MinD-like ATPase involved in chromosome partitioning or flagellar assembly n=1 Tax=Fulvimarina manganoxydans TaxID=937218 RepID=A0A1W2EYC5_9HYPH|nr:P-loop NTPase [Fulvimarina manganoxydans]SMD14572.1 MinD-like ATPase involved in chromosome partitioning or flagellar assembly [Fulvimarina manganoxydans]
MSVRDVQCDDSRGERKQVRITVASGKGGVGKSGLVINLAAAAAAAGYTVAILDTDTDQHSCVEWRQAGGKLEVIKADPADVPRVLQRLINVDFVVIDTCGAVLASHTAAIDCADLVLIPLSTSARERAPALRTFKKAYARGRTIRFVLSLVDPSATEDRLEGRRAEVSSAVKCYLDSAILSRFFMKTVNTRRVPLRDAMDQGGSAFTQRSTLRSRIEFEALLEEIVTIIRTPETI